MKAFFIILLLALTHAVTVGMPTVARRNELYHSMVNLASAMLRDEVLQPADKVAISDELTALHTSIHTSPEQGKYDFEMIKPKPFPEFNERIPKKADPYAIEAIKDNKMSKEFLAGQEMRQKLKDYMKKFEVESEIIVVDDDGEVSSHPVDLKKYDIPSSNYASHLIKIDSLADNDIRNIVLPEVDLDDTMHFKDQLGNTVSVIPGIDTEATVSHKKLSKHPVSSDQLDDSQKKAYASHLLQVDAVDSEKEAMPKEDVIVKEPAKETPKTPDVKTPDVSTPDVNTPDVSTPDVNTPDVSTPDVKKEEKKDEKVDLSDLDLSKLDTPEDFDKENTEQIDNGEDININDDTAPEGTDTLEVPEDDAKEADLSDLDLSTLDSPEEFEKEKEAAEEP